MAGTASPIYSIGDPTPEEQLGLELLNRARRDPATEAERLIALDDPDIRHAIEFFEVDLDAFRQAMAELQPAPPLALNPRLTEAARLHSQDMLENAFQGHVGSDGSHGDDRLADQGYTWRKWGENVFAHSLSTLYAHAAFEIDWGNGPDGMQDPPGHRISLHAPDYREVGIGIIDGSTEEVGPQLVTQLFASPRDDQPYITGAAYYDLDGDEFYDMGEGIGGVEVSVAGLAGSALTADSGGYAFPVPEDGEYTVVFSAAGLPALERSVRVTDHENAKLDFRPSYSPPVVNGPSQVTVGEEAVFEFEPVGAATAYQWEIVQKIAADAQASAEDGLSDFDLDVSPDYEVLEPEIQADGSYSYHLTHTRSDTSDQILTWERRFQVTPETELSFLSRIGWALVHQQARVEIRSVSESEWHPVWTQNGTGGSGEITFTKQEIPLADFEGEEILIRFVFATEGAGFHGSDFVIGWYLDDIRLTGGEEWVDRRRVQVKQAEPFRLERSKPGTYSLRARPKSAGHWLPWGPRQMVRVQDAGRFRIVGLSRSSSEGLHIRFRIGEEEPSSLTLESAPSVTGPWSIETGAAWQPGDDPNQFEFVLPSPSPEVSQRYFRVRQP